jgi:hypothetical protein
MKTHANDNINLDYSNMNYKFAFEFCRDQETLII